MPPSFVPPQTPALVVDWPALEHNLDTMQALCDDAGVRLRPHGKMHKCATIGHLQIARGASGLCAQTVGEAEAFVHWGIKDVLVTSPGPEWAAPRLAALGWRARIGATADHPRQIGWLSDAASEAGITINLVVDVDPGNHRTGADPSEVVALARLAASAPGLRYVGIQMYAGHIQHYESRDERKRAYDDVIARAAAVVGALDDAGLHPDVVTGGGTGTYAFDLASGVFTELQAGSYVFMDVEYGACDAPAGEWPFRQALWVASTVVSANHPTHVTVDAGVKAMNADGPAAVVAGGAPQGSTWRQMGDEHGFIDLPPGASGVPALGDIVWLQPGHIDPTVNLYDAYFMVGENGGRRWPIDARRRTEGERAEDRGQRKG